MTATHERTEQPGRNPGPNRNGPSPLGDSKAAAAGVPPARNRNQGAAALRRRWPIALLILFSALPAGFLAARSNSCTVASFTTNTSDALVFRTAAELLYRGESPYDNEAQERHIARTRDGGRWPPYHLPFAYPPNALPLFMLYLVGPPRVAFVLFVSVGTVLMLATMYRLTGRFCRNPLDRAAAVVGTGFGGATLFNSVIGQTGTYLAATVFAFVGWYRRAPILSGIALGLMAFKPQYALPLGIVAVMDRRWRTVLASGATFLACCLLSGLLFGFEQWAAFREAVGLCNYTMSYMANWFAVAIALLPQARDQLHAAGMPVMLVGTMGLALYCALDRRVGDRSMRHLAVGAALAPLVSPNTHPYDLIIWMFPVCLAAKHARWLPVGAAVFLIGLAVRCILIVELRWLLPLMSVGLLILTVRPLREDRLAIGVEPLALPEPSPPGGETAGYEPQA